MSKEMRLTDRQFGVLYNAFDTDQRALERGQTDLAHFGNPVYRQLENKGLMTSRLSRGDECVSLSGGVIIRRLFYLTAQGMALAADYPIYIKRNADKEVELSYDDDEYDDEDR